MKLTGIILLTIHTTLTTSFTPIPLSPSYTSTTKLHSLKPAAIPLLASGKALARSGELLIDATATPTLDSYGGGLSGTGANIRNAGDCIAQAAASCRFKTASELVCDELREAATCLLEGVEQLEKAVDDALVDDDVELSNSIRPLIPAMKIAGTTLEEAGAGILKRLTLAEIGESMVQCGIALEELAQGVQNVSPGLTETKESYGRMIYGAEMMREAGNNLKGIEKPKKKGKAWLKA
eukprot:CAMPEP_0197245276 /NCGR_PEP_ID=MMETSP1429-20130617/10108_1 /TAXON_ID=49237 /ORGANISM="Chaetoceros  sp., Strain UNC1202" /LENGTH=236 /DNA_ID=CAMNT_0042705739 /DNA_START=103 /DNA_END=813 /DNA_ORIENTATION=-